MSNTRKFKIISDLAQLLTSIAFKAEDPFPLLADDSYSYEAAKEHSILVDTWLGLPLEEKSAEDLQLSGLQTWSHLSPQQFQTPYCEIRSLLEKLNLQPNETLIDLGCGYGRVGFVLDKHFPQVHFLGYEIHPHRVDIASEKFHEMNMKKAQIKLQNIAAPDFTLPFAEAYFIFDFGHKSEILIVLEHLKQMAAKRSIQVIGRGRATRHFIQQMHPWLSQVNDPQHTSNYSIYKS